VNKIFNLNENEKQELINGSYQIVDKYSIDRFYENVMRVYKRAIRKYW